MKTIQELLNLENRTALITGGFGHIGNSIACALSEAGANVVVFDIETSTPESGRPCQHESYCVDITNKTQVTDTVNKLEAEGKNLDILVNCAALVGSDSLNGWSTPVSEQNIETWQKCFDVNLTASFHIIQQCLPMLHKSAAGSIINIGSIYGLAGQKLSMYKGMNYLTPAAYASSKGGLLQLTRYLASVLGPSLRVNSISPGGIERKQDKNFIKRYEACTPLQRMGTEEDIKGAALYLASDLSNYVTGQNIVIDGGWSL